MALDTLHALSESLSDRQTKISTFEKYYDGTQPLEFDTTEHREKFGSLLKRLVDNYCELVVNAKAERMVVTGFRFGEDEADDAAWDIWQANSLDKYSRMAHRTALTSEVAYATVWPTADTRRWWERLVTSERPAPRIAIEHPSQMIVDYEPGDRATRRAALKRWKGTDGHIYATVYLPNAIHKYRSIASVDDPMKSTGQVAAWDEFDVVPNPFGVVPVIPLANDPGLLAEGRSELRNVIPIQDVVNKLWRDLIVSSDFGAYVQRVLTGVEVPLDPETNQPLEGWKPTVDRLLATPNENAKAYSLDATELQNFINAIDAAVSSLAIKSRTPPHYLNASADRLSGESIKSSETGLVSAVKEKLEYFGEGWEEVMRLAFLMQGDRQKASLSSAETNWRDPEVRSDAEQADRVVKLKEAGIPFRQRIRDLGYSDVEQKQILEWRRIELLETQAVDLSDLDANRNPEPDVA